MPRPRWTSNTRTAAFSWRSPPSRTVRTTTTTTTRGCDATRRSAGLGIFTGIDLLEGDGIAEPDLVVPFHEDYGHFDFDFLWRRYSWEPSELGMHFDMHDGLALVLGTGCVPNCDFALLNAREGTPSYDHAGLHRGRDVGTTGFTGYHGQKMIATRYVPAGGEIFVSYGEDWFLNRPEQFGDVPLAGNYHEVDVFLAKFRYLALKHGRSTSSSTKKMGKDNDENDDDDDGGFSRDLWEVAKAFGHYFGTRNAAALPVSFEDMLVAQRDGSAESRLPYSVRTPGWLEANGRCMDNIRPGNSTIRQAGRGAFASRFIPGGGLVAPGPLLHVPNRTALHAGSGGGSSDGTETHDYDDDYKHAPPPPPGAKLILNYCFGHGMSTVVLCPYTSPSAYINHGRGSVANVRVRWSDASSTPNHNAHWLEEDVDFLKGTVGVGLSIDFVATRDIHPGEEVFLDYGPEWEAAWEEHAGGWSPPPGSEGYVPASVLGEPLRTLDEQSSKPYPENIVFYCNYGYHPGDPEGSFQWEDKWMYERLCPCQIVSRLTRDADGDETAYYYTAVMLTSDQVDADMIPNFILRYHDEDFDRILSPQEVIPPPGEVHILTNVPRRAIEVRDKVYAKDEFARGAFRHAMMMPDDVFPEAWKNIAR